VRGSNGRSVGAVLASSASVCRPGRRAAPRESPSSHTTMSRFARPGPPYATLRVARRPLHPCAAIHPSAMTVRRMNTGPSRGRPLRVRGSNGRPVGAVLASAASVCRPGRRAAPRESPSSHTTMSRFACAGCTRGRHKGGPCGLPVRTGVRQGGLSPAQAPEPLRRERTRGRGASRSTCRIASARSGLAPSRTRRR